MAHLTYPFTITPNTLASASQVMGNFDAIKNILNGGIDGTNLADGAVLSGKLANDAVVTAKVKDKNITTSKLDDGAVTTAKINNGAVTAAKIDDGAVTTMKIDDGAVTTAKIADGAVTQAKMDPSLLGVIGGPGIKIYSGTFGAEHDIDTGAIVLTGSLPDGWSATRIDEGYWEITHNLGTHRYALLFSSPFTYLEPLSKFEINSRDENKFTVTWYNDFGFDSDSPFLAFILIC